MSLKPSQAPGCRERMVAPGAGVTYSMTLPPKEGLATPEDVGCP